MQSNPQIRSDQIQSADKLVVALPAEAEGPLLWAYDHLVAAARARGAELVPAEGTGETPALELRVDPNAARDAFAFVPGAGSLLLSGEPRGLVYGLLELADRMACGGDPVRVITEAGPESHVPTTPLRSLLRYFTNRELDYSWYTDPDFWPGFLTELAVNRFGRFSMAFGLGQDYGHDHGVTDNYLSFIYPFLFDVPGFDVRARGVDAAEQAVNLEALRHIARETTRRGLDFNLSLWAHNYTFPQSPDLTHPILGLDSETWPRYSGRALRQLLEEIPEISGLTFRIHYEGGVPDNDRHRYWSAVLAELKGMDRTVAIDIHSKGADAATLALFEGAGMPLTVSTKFAGEHLTLPYHAASIRPQERVPAKVDGDQSITRGARIFTRYSYGDFLSRDRKYDLVARVWNGTQRILLWADPVFAEAMGREAAFDGSKGIEVFDPLSLRGRWSTAGDVARTGYTDSSLEPERDWQKYRAFYRAWGRGQYGGQESIRAAWQRYLRHAHGAAGEGLGEAIAAASRVLPLIMSVHAPGAGNRDYWPEFYEDVPYLDSGTKAGDGSRKRLGTVSPLDPALFYSIADYVRDDGAGTLDGRYRPTEIAGWLDGLAKTMETGLDAASNESSPETRRLVIDAGLQAHMARFFAAKFRAGLHYERFRLEGDGADLQASARLAEQAARHWEDTAALGATAYAEDIGFGRPERLSGSWSTRLARVREHAAALAEMAAAEAPGEGREAGPFAPIRDLAALPEFTHDPIGTYAVGRPLDIAITVPGAEAVHLHYRPVNHALQYASLPMTRDGDRFVARIPGEHLQSEFDLIYFFTASVGGVPWMVPGLGPDLSARPYLLARGRENTVSKPS